MTTIQLALGAAYGIPFTAIFISLPVTFYLSHRDTEHIESLLPNCKFVNNNRKLYSDFGLTGKIIRFGALSLMLVFSEAYARRGLINLDEVDRLPARMKKRLCRLVIFNLALFLALLLLHACQHFI